MEPHTKLPRKNAKCKYVDDPNIRFLKFKINLGTHLNILCRVHISNETYQDQRWLAHQFQKIFG